MGFDDAVREFLSPVTDPATWMWTVGEWPIVFASEAEAVAFAEKVGDVAVPVAA